MPFFCDLGFQTPFISLTSQSENLDKNTDDANSKTAPVSGNLLDGRSSSTSPGSTSSSPILTSTEVKMTPSISTSSSSPYHQSCKNVPTVPTSRCYFFWPVLIFGKSTRKTGDNSRKHTNTGEKLVGANFYAFCNYDTSVA